MNSLPTLCKKNAKAMAAAFVRGYDLISGGTDNHGITLD
jgi:glycine/serine hydroxymethyltransferase